MSGQLTLEEIRQLIGAELEGSPNILITGAASLEGAKETEVSFLVNPRYRSLLKESRAGAVILSPEEEREKGRNYLVVKNPTSAFQQVIEAFYKKRLRKKAPGIHPTALIDPSAIVGKEVQIGPYVVVEAGSCIGDRTVLDAHVFIGENVTIGSDCRLYPHVVVREETRIGDRVILQPGCVLGSCGFGYYPNAAGNHIKLNQIGIVEIQDDVEIGANTTIDRARFDKTVIGAGTKIDNQVQIGHNVRVGKSCLFVSQVGIAGSTEIGNHVVLGGQVGINGHIKLDDHVMVGACSAVSKSIPAGKYLGIPAEPAAEYLKTQAFVRQLSKMSKQLKSFFKSLAPH